MMLAITKTAGITIDTMEQTFKNFISLSFILDANPMHTIISDISPIP